MVLCKSDHAWFCHDCDNGPVDGSPNRHLSSDVASYVISTKLEVQTLPRQFDRFSQFFAERFPVEIPVVPKAFRERWASIPAYTRERSPGVNTQLVRDHLSPLKTLSTSSRGAPSGSWRRARRMARAWGICQ